MYRDALHDLKQWKESSRRKPLIIEGARQVGKTWLMKEFGAQEYRNTVRAGTKQPTVAGSMNQKMGRDLKPGSRQHDQPTAIQFTIISSPSL